VGPLPGLHEVGIELVEDAETPRISKPESQPELLSGFIETRQQWQLFWLDIILALGGL
jgi:hypothetical protein